MTTILQEILGETGTTHGNTCNCSSCRSQQELALEGESPKSRKMQPHRQPPLQKSMPPQQRAAPVSPARPQVLRRGATGQPIQMLQQKINRKATRKHLRVDGVFGPKTEAAVIAYQRARGIEANGIVGQGTWQALQSGKPTCTCGAYPAAEEPVQPAMTMSAPAPEPIPTPVPVAEPVPAPAAEQPSLLERLRRVAGQLQQIIGTMSNGQTMVAPDPAETPGDENEYEFTWEN